MSESQQAATKAQLFAESRRAARAMYDKKHAALVNYCVGRNYHSVLKAIAVAEPYHNGYRRNKITPEFQHQIDIALYATTLKGLSYEIEEALLLAVVVHDLMEDYPEARAEIMTKLGEQAYLRSVKLSKIRDGVKLSNEEYFAGMLDDVICVLAKLCDRVNNVGTMGNGFTYEKMGKYVEEVNEYFIPMLQKAKGLHPELRQAFNNIKLMLEGQTQWVVLLLSNHKQWQQELEAIAHTQPTAAQSQTSTSNPTDTPQTPMSSTSGLVSTLGLG